MENPFSYGTTATGKYFTNREEDLLTLKNSLLHGINTTIISPRRWGKSSLVEKAITEIAQDSKIKTVTIDMFAVNSEHEFYELFARECIKASSGKFIEWMQSGMQLFKNIIPKLSVGVDPHQDFSVSFQWEDAQKHYLEILNLPEVMGKKQGVRFIIAIDEFQNIVSFDENGSFEKKIRSVWQRQTLVTYCLYGSKRHMMNDLFNNPSKPFYRFGNITFLPKIKAEKWQFFIKDGFHNTNKEIAPGFVQAIITEMQCHSWYVQQFSYFVWVATSHAVTDEIFRDARVRLVESNVPFFMNICENLSPRQINLLKAVSSGESQLSSSVVLRRYALGTSGTVTKNKNVLLEKDLLDQDESGLHFRIRFLKYGSGICTSMNPTLNKAKLPEYRIFA